MLQTRFTYLHETQEPDFLPKMGLTGKKIRLRAPFGFAAFKLIDITLVEGNE